MPRFSPRSYTVSLHGITEGGNELDSCLAENARHGPSINTLRNAVNIATPTVCEAIFIVELNTNQSFRKAAVVTLI
jgi:hypothetical protein